MRPAASSGARSTTLRRHANQSDRRQSRGPESGRRRRLRRARPGALGIDDRQHGRDATGGDHQFHRWRSRGHHATRQSLRVPYVVHAGDVDAETGPLHQERNEGAIDRHRLHQQRFRQGRTRRDGQGARGAGDQGRRRRLDRSRAGRLVGPRAEDQAERPGCAVRLPDRGRGRAPAARVEEAGIQQAHRWRDHDHRSEGHRAGRRRRRRNPRPRRPDGRCAAGHGEGIRREVSRRNTSSAPITTA